MALKVSLEHMKAMTVSVTPPPLSRKRERGAS